MLQRGWLTTSSIWVSISTVMLKNALHIPSRRRGHLAGPAADTAWAMALHSRTSLTFSLHPPWRCGEGAVGWRRPLQAGVETRWREEGPCRGCSSPSYLPLPGTVGLRGNLRWEGIYGGSWQAGNRKASRTAGLFSRTSVHGSPRFGVKGSFCCSQVKLDVFQEPLA